MPSSKDRQRVEIPSSLYERLKLIAESEERTLTSLLQDLVRLGLSHYQPVWAPRHFMSRFNEPAQRALALAREEAQQLHHDYVGTEHLLLGLLRVEDGVAAHVLHQLWIEIDQVRKALVYIMTNYAKKQTEAASSVEAESVEPEATTGTTSTPAPEEAQVSQSGSSGAESIGLTPRTRQVLALAVDEAQRLHHDYVGTEHLLLALAREGEGLAAGILQQFGALGKVREFTLAEMQRRTAQPTEPTTLNPTA
jgi:ATP-dependent Clp protease ATP-binding subunit ClpA